MPEKRYKIFRDKVVLYGLPEGSTDISQLNMLDRYLDWPDSNFQQGKYVLINTLGSAEFLSNYYVQPKLRLSTNHSQPFV